MLCSAWKVIVSLVLVPALWIFYSAAACVLAFKGLAAPWGEEVCLATFFAMPFLFYGSILAGERTAQLAKSLPALVTSLLGREHGKELLEQRRELLEAMLGLADDSGWAAPEEKEERSDSGSGLFPVMSVTSLDQLEALHRDSLGGHGGRSPYGSPPGHTSPQSPRSPAKPPTLSPSIE